MTDINLDELIAEARSLSTYEGSTLERAADALEQVRRSADEWWKQYDAERKESERLRSTLARILGYVRGAVRRGIPSFEDEYGAEHDATLIESLADELVHKGIFAPDEGYLDAYEPSHVQWLREKARERREGVS